MMEAVKLTSGQEDGKSDRFEQLKDLLIRWLKPIPADQFEKMSRKLEDDWYEQFEETKNYSNRYGKSMFLDEIRCADSLTDINNVFSCLKLENDIWSIFLCTKIAANHAEIVYPLVVCVKDDDYKSRLWDNYKIIRERGLKNLCESNEIGEVELRGIRLFEKVLPGKRFILFECYSLADRWLDAFSPEKARGYIFSKGADERFAEGGRRWSEEYTKQWILPPNIILSDKLSGPQKLLLAKIEGATAAQVILWKNKDKGDDAYEGVLSNPRIMLKKYYQPNSSSQSFQTLQQEYGRLCYVKHQLRDLTKYPASVQHELKILQMHNNPGDWLSSSCQGRSIDKVLSRMEEYSQLIKLGWHLERNIEFFSVENH